MEQFKVKSSTITGEQQDSPSREMAPDIKVLGCSKTSVSILSVCFAAWRTVGVNRSNAPELRLLLETVEGEGARVRTNLGPS